MPHTLTPVIPLVDFIPPGSGTNYTTWGFKSHYMKYPGFSVKSITGTDGTSPSTIYVGFNKQPPALFQINDAFHYPLGFKSIEFYADKGVGLNITALLFLGKLYP